LGLLFQKATIISPEMRHVSKETLPNVPVRVNTEPQRLLDPTRMTRTKTKVEQPPSRRSRNWILLISHMERRRKNIMRRMMHRMMIGS